jgi:hypothetical protein
VLITIVVLSGEDRRLSSSGESSFSGSVSNPQSHISLSGLASLVGVVGLVHSVQEITVGICGSWSRRIVGDGVGGCSITDSDHWISVILGAHVLDIQVAVKLAVSTAVLVGPFNSELRSLIKAHGRSPAVSSLGVVL